jgi:hypothetical protein
MHVLFVILRQNDSAPPAMMTMKNLPMGRVTRQRIFKGLLRGATPSHFVSNIRVPHRFYCACFYCRSNDTIAEARASDRPWSACLGLGPRRWVLLGDQSLKFSI